jgi:DNA-dependent protein kinase catalytic subunit
MKHFYYTEPDESAVVKIASFDESILIMRSIRRPKRLTIFGTDEKTYKILVKGIEDLRLDQRIEQLFTVMSSLLENSADQRDLKICTFAVVPMTKTLGILEWVDQTKVMKEILETEFKAQCPGMDLGETNPAFKDRVSFIERECL